MVTQMQDAPLSDSTLMAQLAEGHTGALAELYRRYAKLLFSVMNHVAPWLSAADLEDLCQETFLELHRAATRYEERGQLRAYLCSMATRRARGLSRQKATRRGLLERFWSKATEPVSTAPQGEVDMRQAINQAVMALPAGQREVLWLHVVDGLDTDEIAVALGLNANAVWTRLCRARQAVMKAVGRQP